MKIYLFPSDDPESYTDITGRIISGTATIDVSALNTMTFTTDFYIPCGYRIVFIPNENSANWTTPSYSYEFVVEGQKVSAVGTDLTRVQIKPTSNEYDYTYSYTAVSALYYDLSGVILNTYVPDYPSIYLYFDSLYKNKVIPWQIRYSQPIFPGNYQAGTVWDWLLKNWEYIYIDNIDTSYIVPMCNFMYTVNAIRHETYPIIWNRNVYQQVVQYDTRTYPSKILDTHSANVISFSRNFENQIIYNNSKAYDKNNIPMGSTYGSRGNHGTYKLKETIEGEIQTVQYKPSKLVKLPYDFTVASERQNADRWMHSNRFLLTDASPTYEFKLYDGSEYNVGDIVMVITHGLSPVDKKVNSINNRDTVCYVARKKINLIDGHAQIELGNSTKYQVKMESRK